MKGACLGYGAKYRGKTGMMIAAASLYVICRIAVRYPFWNDRFRCWKGNIALEDEN